MNPLDLRGPEFLVFYVIVSLLVLVLLYVARSSAEGGRAPRLDAGDAYQIAFLRGGANEALRVATVMLIDRKLLQADALAGQIVARAKPDAVRWPVEQALVRHFHEPHAPQTIFGHPTLEAACEPYERHLTELGLLPSSSDRARRRRLVLTALLVLVGLSAAKLTVAFARGRSNVLFLIVLTFGVSVVVFAVARPRLTTRGRAVLADLRRLFQRLRDRAATVSAGGASDEAALLAAVFGLGVLSSAHFAYARQLFPKTSRSSSSGCGSSCGSSCGGGGCGGGCGGS